MVNRVVKTRRLLLLCLALLASTSTNALAIGLLTNGDFEATASLNGPIPGWTLFQQSGSVGQFYLDTPGTTIPSGDSTLQALDTPDNLLTPGGGNQYAISVPTNPVNTDQGPAAHALYQSFSLPGIPTSVNLNFQLFSRDFYNYGVPINTDGLDYNSPTPNQRARVDLLRGGASPLSTNASDIILTLYDTVGAADSGWIQFNRDITGLVTPGQSYTIRFGTVSNRQVIAMGVDNVQIEYLGSFAVPESGTGLLFAAPAILLLAGAVRQRRKTVAK